MPKEKKPTLTESLDTLFSSIQRVIYKSDEVSDDMKERMISFSIQCNDMLVKMISSQL